jgi:hypothetical protein
MVPLQILQAGSLGVHQLGLLAGPGIGPHIGLKKTLYLHRSTGAFMVSEEK